MGAIVVVGAWICSGIAAAAAAIASVIVTICSAIYTAIAVIGGALVGLFAGIGAGVLSSLGILSSEMAISLGTTIGSISSIAGSMYFTVGAWIETIGVWFKTFLEVIHFETLKKINDIAYLVSSDYREYMNKIYGKISEFSEAISGNAQFAVQLIENARAVVLDTSSMLGRPYDVGQLTWLNEFETFLREIQRKADKYENNPYELINDINELILKPAYDLKAEEMRGVLSAIDQVIEIVDGTVSDIVKIRNDVQKLVADLPESIYNRIGPSVENALEYVHHFVDDMYYPTVDKLRSSMKVMIANDAVREDKMKSIVERLKRPAKLLEASEELPDKERLEDYEIYADLPTRIYRQPVTAWRKYAKPYTEEFLRIGELITKPRALPQWEVPEMEVPKGTTVVKSGGAGTPFPEDV